MHVDRPSRRSARSRTFVSILAAVVLLIVAIAALPSSVSAQAAHRKVVSKVAPEYPDTLRIAQIGGLVRLSATVQADGKVTQVEIRGGNPILAEKAQQAVLKWKYAPAAAQTVEEVSLSFSPH